MILTARRGYTNIISSKILHLYHPREMLCHIDSRIVELPLPWYKYLLSVALLAPPIALLKCTPVWQCGWCIFTDWLGSGSGGSF